MLSGSESKQENEIVQNSPVLFYSLPVEIQLFILEQLISDPKFLTHLLSFSRVAKWPNELIKDATLWKKIAAYWFSKENVELTKATIVKTLELFDKTQDEKLKNIYTVPAQEGYHFYSEALVGITSAGNHSTLKRVLTKLKVFDYPRYIGSALEVACKAGNIKMATLLLNELLTKKQHGRDHLIKAACRGALEKNHWDIVSLLLQQDACRKESQLLGEILQKAAQSKQPTIVKQIIQNDLDKLSIMDKWAIVGTPGFVATGLDANDLFANHTWVIRKSLSVVLNQLGSQSLSPMEEKNGLIEADDEGNQVDIDAITSLLADLALEAPAPLLIVSDIAAMTTNNKVVKQQPAEALKEVARAKVSLANSL